MEKTIRLCDGCAKEIDHNERFWKVQITEMRNPHNRNQDTHLCNLDFCKKCMVHNIEVPEQIKTNIKQS